MANPHAGVDMSGAANPHAGMDMSGANPHAMGPDPMAALAPDPDRAIDPSKFVRGVIRFDKGVKEKLNPGGVIFVVAKRADPSNPQGVGAPIAVDRLEVGPALIPFHLTEANMMMAGSQLSGEVVISARYDQDADAMTRQPGDVTGLAKATVPAKDVEVVLSTFITPETATGPR
jgi:hypothetical protein